MWGEMNNNKDGILKLLEAIEITTRGEKKLLSSFTPHSIPK